MKDPEGRFCRLDLTLFQQRFTLAVVYGPNNDDPNFFLQLSEKIGAVGNEAVIAVGDWNVVLDYEWIQQVISIKTILKQMLQF